MNSAKWVLPCKLSEMTADTVAAIQQKMTRGIWPEGLVWRLAPDKRRRINVEAYNKWVEGQLGT